MWVLFIYRTPSYQLLKSILTPDLHREKERVPIRVWLVRIALIVALMVLTSTATSESVIVEKAVRLQSPFYFDSSNKAEPYDVVTFDVSEYSSMTEMVRVVLTEFPLTADSSVDLDLEQFNVTTHSTVLVGKSGNKTFDVASLELTLWRGTVVGQPGSTVFLAISPYMIKGYIRVDGKTTSIGSIRDKTRSNECLLLDAGMEDPIFDMASDMVGTPQALESALTPSAGEFKIADLAIETDSLFSKMFVEVEDPDRSAAAYVIALTGAVSQIYERDLQTKLVISWMRIWPCVNPTSIGPYPYSSLLVLDEFATYWAGHMRNISRTLAVCMQGDVNPTEHDCGGQGRVDGLCSLDNGFCSFGLGDCYFEPVPRVGAGDYGIADIWVFAHESGHVFGSGHTHCYSPPIDSCAAEDGCYSGVPHHTPGTIMSYCLPLSDMNLAFHSRCITRMRQSVDAASCMRIARNPVYVDKSNTGSEDGTLDHPYNSIIEGVETVIPGGDVMIRPGTYDEQRVVPYLCVLKRWGTLGSVVIGQ